MWLWLEFCENLATLLMKLETNCPGSFFHLVLRYSIPDAPSLGLNMMDSGTLSKKIN